MRLPRIRCAGIRHGVAGWLARLPRRCPSCHGRVGPVDLLFGRGMSRAEAYRCRHCATPISPPLSRYGGVAAIAFTGAVVIAQLAPTGWRVPLVLLFGGAVLAATYYLLPLSDGGGEGRGE